MTSNAPPTVSPASRARSTACFSLGRRRAHAPHVILFVDALSVEKRRPADRRAMPPISNTWLAISIRPAVSTRRAMTLTAVRAAAVSRHPRAEHVTEILPDLSPPADPHVLAADA
jgi:hypothetical protein